MGKNVIRIYGGITIYVDVILYKPLYINKKIMFGVLLYVIVRIKNI